MLHGTVFARKSKSWWYKRALHYVLNWTMQISRQKPHRFENALRLAAVSNRQGFADSLDRCRVNGRCNRIEIDVVTNETALLCKCCLSITFTWNANGKKCPCDHDFPAIFPVCRFAFLCESKHFRVCHTVYTWNFIFVYFHVTSCLCQKDLKHAQSIMVLSCL